MRFILFFCVRNKEMKITDIVSLIQEGKIVATQAEGEVYLDTSESKIIKTRRRNHAMKLMENEVQVMKCLQETPEARHFPIFYAYTHGPDPEGLSKQDQLEYLVQSAVSGKTLSEYQTSPTSIYVQHVMSLLQLLRRVRPYFTHYDLHQGNIFIDPKSGGVHLIDFGYSALHRRTTGCFTQLRPGSVVHGMHAGIHDPLFDYLQVIIRMLCMGRPQNRLTPVQIQHISQLAAFVGFTPFDYQQSYQSSKSFSYGREYYHALSTVFKAAESSPMHSYSHPLLYIPTFQETLDCCKQHSESQILKKITHFLSLKTPKAISLTHRKTYGIYLAAFVLIQKTKRREKMDDDCMLGLLDTVLNIDHH